MIRTDVPVPYQEVRRLFAAVVDFEPLGRRVVVLVAQAHKSKSDQCYVATSCGSEKKNPPRQTKGAAWGRHEKTHIFPTRISPVKRHHLAWLGGYVFMHVHAPVREGQSVPFTGRYQIGLSEDIVFNWRR